MPVDVQEHFVHAYALPDLSHSLVELSLRSRIILIYYELILLVNRLLELLCVLQLLHFLLLLDYVLGLLVRVDYVFDLPTLVVYLLVEL